MAVLCGPHDVQDGRDARAGPRDHGYLAVSPEALDWLNQCCGLRWQNMTEVDLQLATTPRFLPYVERGGNPIEDTTVCENKVGL